MVLGVVCLILRTKAPRKVEAYKKKYIQACNGLHGSSRITILFSNARVSSMHKNKEGEFRK